MNYQPILPTVALVPNTDMKSDKIYNNAFRYLQLGKRHIFMNFGFSPSACCNRILNVRKGHSVHLYISNIQESFFDHALELAIYRLYMACENTVYVHIPKYNIALERELGKVLIGVCVWINRSMKISEGHNDKKNRAYVEIIKENPSNTTVYKAQDNSMININDPFKTLRRRYKELMHPRKSKREFEHLSSRCIFRIGWYQGLITFAAEGVLYNPDANDPGNIDVIESTMSEVILL